jgi:outer membrane protein assembly factor BamB
VTTPRRLSAAIGLAFLLGATACSSNTHHQAVPPPTATTTPAAAPSPTGSATTTQPTTTTRPPATTRPAPATAGDWTTYQGSPARLGVAPDQPTLAPLHQAWTASLDGTAIYGQPLYFGGRVLVATEGDNIYALDPANGSVKWHVSLGPPLANVQAQAGCGDIDPLGITSTPVVDPTTGLLYVVGEVSTAGAAPVHHQMVAIDTRTGAVVDSRAVDPPVPAGEDVVHLLQRAALALGNGRVYVSYGGQFGDCGTYHGWVVSVPVVHGAGGLTAFNVTPDSTGGAIWGGGAGPSIGADGSVFVTTGNPNSGGSSPWSEAAVKLAPALGAAPEAAFQDTAATGDLDLSTGTAVLLPDGRLFTAGKTDIGYLLRQGDLGLVKQVSGSICGSDPDGGAAFDAALDTLYLPCRDGGLQEVQLNGNRTGWRAGSVNSTPLLVDHALWAVGYPSGIIEELNAQTGAVLYRSAVGRAVPTFVTPAAAAGLLLIPTTTGLVAEAGPATKG